MPNLKLIKILRNISILLEIKGENPFKARAYSNAANILESSDIDVVAAVMNNTLKDIKGFGEALQKKISDYVINGKMSYYEKLVSEIPESLVQITRISGIGPKKTKLLYDSLGIKSIEELESAAINGKLAGVKGFTQKSIEGIINNIQHIKAAKGRYLQQQIIADAQRVKDEVLKITGVKYAEFTGSFRRFTETIEQLDLLIGYDGDEDLTKLSNNYSLAIPLKTEVCSLDKYFWLLLQHTGSDSFISSFNNIINQKGYTISEDGIEQNSKQLIFNSEEEIFQLLNIQYIPPELREKQDIIKDAIGYKIPELIKESDLKGMLHCHSKWSDGKNTIKEMALKSKEIGFEYFAICDHSQSAGYANGLQTQRVIEQHNEIDELNHQNLGIHIFKGIESDILSDGSLDYDEEILKRFEIVVSSIHSSFKMSKERMTNRMIYAIKSPYTTIIGHPTGRLLLSRPPYELDINDVIDAAVEEGKIIEINANPYRLDLSWEDVIYAKKKGLKIAINPDSHSVDTLTDVFIGVKVARKGGLQKSDVINCLKRDEFYEEVVRK